MRAKAILIKLFLLFGVFFVNFKTNAQNENYIDYSKKSDREWIQKIDNQFKDTDKNNYHFSLESNFVKKDNSFLIQIEYNYIIEDNINRYLNYKWLPKVLGLLEFYKPLLSYKLKEYGLPQELMYLAIVESNLNPTAVSPVGAMGLWQFMPETGNNYGLKKGQFVNTFYDPVLATDSACRFLKYLYEMLGNWNLVLSAYNSGLGNVSKAIKKAKTDNYWEVRKYLPAETRAYVPAFHALKYIGNSLSTFYKSIPSLKYSFADVSEEYITEPTTFKEFSKKNKVNLQTLYFLNPHILTERVPANVILYVVFPK